MSAKKNKAKIVNDTNKILEETMPKYINKLKENNDFLLEKLNEWESIHPNCNNPSNLNTHIQSLQSELDEWRTLIPNCQTVAKARTYLKRQLVNQADAKPQSNMDWNLYYGEFKEFLKNEGHDVFIFNDLDSFLDAKNSVIDVILDPSKQYSVKIAFDHRFHFIHFFKYKYLNDIDDKDVDIRMIFSNQLVKL